MEMRDSDNRPFPFYEEVHVRFRDVDAMGHVNNAVYFTYMEMARTAFFTRFLEIEKPLDIPIILGEARCRYLSPAYFGERLRVGLGVSRWGNRSFDFVYRIEGGDGRMVAAGHSVMVMYDYTREQSLPIPAEFREQIDSFQGAWIPPADL